MEGRVVVSGKRKHAVARAIVLQGTGIVTFNKGNYQHLHLLERLRIEEPLRIAEQILGSKNFDVHVQAHGGGAKGQIEAARLAIARGIVKLTKSIPLRKAYLQYDKTLLVADIRRKEAYKPGDSKARARRQKSYR